MYYLMNVSRIHLKKTLDSVYLQGHNINKKQPESIFPMKTIYVFERKRNHWFKKKKKKKKWRIPYLKKDMVI